MEPDFSGWATKAGIPCSDGRTILPNAFEHQDTLTVPLVWSHDHDNPENVLGHAVLENRPEGVYAYGYFNDTPRGQASKVMVAHKDITSLSIWANALTEKAKKVVHGMIREVSLVMAGANPGAKIDVVTIAHGDGTTTDLDEAVIFSGETIDFIAHASAATADKGVEGPEQMSLEEIFETMSEKQQQAVVYMVGKAVDDAIEHAESEQGAVSADEKQDDSADEQKDAATDEKESEGDKPADAEKESEGDKPGDDEKIAESGTTTEGDLTHKEGNTNMNVFEGNAAKSAGPKHDLTHDQMKSLVGDVIKTAGERQDGSLKQALLAHAGTYGIDDIEVLFPDARTMSSTPELIARRTEWVAGVMDGAQHSPFSRVKSITADLTADQARAKGYVKATLKKDEVIKLLKRVTTPTTIYKKQKLDRDDILDITDLDIVAWLKWEMRFMLEEEIARAILIGDGREPDDEDKINEDHIRPIAWDNEMYSHPVTIPSNSSPDAITESVLRARKHYKGTGRPKFYTTDDVITDMLLIKDRMGRRLYNTEAELAAALRVSELVPVEVMEDTPDLLGILVNISDYRIGADRGGSLTMFDDFDIDYNQYKYLMETRISGALTKPKSAVVIKRTSGTTVTPQTPLFDEETNILTVPNQAGVEYYDVTDPTQDTALAAGTAVELTRTTDVEARPSAGYSFPHNTDNDFTFAYTG